MTIPSTTPEVSQVARRLPLLAGVVVAFAATVVGVGIVDAWIRDRDGDMQQRAAEYVLYRDGIYPNPSIDTFPVERRRRYSVYPPWALPLFAAFFEPGGKLQGRVVVETLSIAALATMGWYGWSRCRHRGVAQATIAATAGAAIAGNASALSLGQFSVICMGFVAAQMLLLERGRPIAAGACWALSMLKPQIGLAFAPLFLTRGNIPGLVVGSFLLAGLSLLACARTEVSPIALLDHWLMGSSLAFNGHALVQRAIESWTGLSQRFLLATGLAAMAAIALAVLWRARRGGDGDSLRLAAPLAVVGMLAVYHRHYDNVMLWPTMLAALERAIAGRGRVDVAIAVALAATLVVHDRVVSAVPFGHVVTMAVWVVAAWHLFRQAAPPVDPSRGTT